jgi:hypothetical protein
MAGFAVLLALGAIAPRAAADGWRAAFLWLSAPPIGAVALLLIARVVGADWDAALKPMLGWTPWLALLAIPLIVDQALFHWPDGHLHIWLSPLAFALRLAVAWAFWAWLARALADGRVLPAGPLLIAHGLVVSVMGYDWLLGSAPAQPNSAAPMILAVVQIGGASALACAAGFGSPTQRRDLAYLLVASALGLAYLLYIDFAIIWFGNLPAHVGWYAGRQVMPAAALPGSALLIGLLVPILFVGLGRDDSSRRRAGTSALLALGLALCWIAAGPAGWLGLLTVLAGVVATSACAWGAAS